MQPWGRETNRVAGKMIGMGWGGCQREEKENLASGPQQYILQPELMFGWGLALWYSWCSLNTSNLYILPTNSCQHWAERYICPLNYLDRHLCIFNVAVSFFPFMVLWNVTDFPFVHRPFWLTAGFGSEH